jgi:hypothetical protein
MGSSFKPFKEWHAYVHFMAHMPDASVRIPGNATPANVPIGGTSLDPKGTFLLLHSCSHHSTDWYMLPEESRITSEVLRRGFVALAPDAAANLGGCWHPTVDGPVLKPAVNMFLKKHNLIGKPLYGVGISSGGVMLAGLISSFGMNFAGVHFAVSPGGAPSGRTSHPVPGVFATHKFPPTSFVYMPQDFFAPIKTIKVAVEALKQKGTPVLLKKASEKPIRELLKRAELMDVSKHVLKRCIQKMFDWGYLESRCATCKKGMAKNFGDTLWLEHFRSDGIVTHLLMDAEVGPWFQPHESRGRAFMEEVHVMEGVHGPTGEHITEVVDFLLHHSGHSEL